MPGNGLARETHFTRQKKLAGNLFLYADWSLSMVNVDAPGSSSANLRSLGHTRCPRPIFPLDANVTSTPKAKLVQRQRHQP